MINKKNAINAYNKAKRYEGSISKPVFPSITEKANVQDQLKTESHSKVKKDGFTAFSNPESFNRTETTGMIKQGLKINNYKKVAKFLILLGSDQAVEIMRQLTSEESENIAAEIAKIQKIDKLEAKTIMDEFSFLKTRIGNPHGGVDTARSILVSTYGEEQGREILRKVLPESEEKPFSFLNDLNSNQLFLLLKKESPEAIAVLIPFLDPIKASEVIKNLPDKDKGIVALKVAKAKQPNMSVINIIEDTLREKIRQQGIKETESIDGSGALANILKYMDVSDEQDIINTLDDDLSKDVREKIFTIDMIVNIDDTDLQKVLSEYSDYAIAVIIKGKSREVEDKILSSVSERRAAFIREEREIIGAMKKEDVNIETKSFLNYLKRLHLQGLITVRMNNDDFI